MRLQVLLAACCTLGTEAVAISYLTDGRALEIRGSGQYQGPNGVVSTQFDLTAPPPPALEVWNTRLMETALLNLPTPQPPIFGPAEFGTSAAGQISSFTLAGFTAQGDASYHAFLGGEDLFGLNPHASGFAISVFDVLFRVDDPMTYRLAGQLQTADLSDSRDRSTLVFTLVGSHDLLNLTDRDHSNGPFENSGILGPGLYRLTASSVASADVDRHDGVSLYADFAVTAEFARVNAVPDGELPFWLVTLLILALCGRAKSDYGTAAGGRVSRKGWPA